jgi:hypothetical protein
MVDQFKLACSCAGIFVIVVWAAVVLTVLALYMLQVVETLVL